MCLSSIKQIRDSLGRQNNIFIQDFFLIHMGNTSHVMLRNHYAKRARIKNPELKLLLYETDLCLMTVIVYTKGPNWCTIQAQNRIWGEHSYCYQMRLRI